MTSGIWTYGSIFVFKYDQFATISSLFQLRRSAFTGTHCLLEIFTWNRRFRYSLEVERLLGGGQELWERCCPQLLSKWGHGSGWKPVPSGIGRPNPFRISAWLYANTLYIFFWWICNWIKWWGDELWRLGEYQIPWQFKIMRLNKTFPVNACTIYWTNRSVRIRATCHLNQFKFIFQTNACPAWLYGIKAQNLYKLLTLHTICLLHKPNKIFLWILFIGIATLDWREASVRLKRRQWGYPFK